MHSNDDNKHSVVCFLCILGAAIVSSSHSCSALLNDRDRNSHARAKQREFGGEGGTAELLWFSKDGRAADDGKTACVVAAEDGGTALLVMSPACAAAPVAAQSPAEMRDENDRAG